MDFDCAQVLPNGDSLSLKTIGYSMCYAAPEVILESQITKQSDIWSLGAVLFELRCGQQLMTDFLNTENDVLRQITQTFGKLPNPLWNAWEGRHYYYDEDGKSKLGKNGKPKAPSWPLSQSIAEVGGSGEKEAENAACLSFAVEPLGAGIPENEASQMEDLIIRMMSYDPKSRLSLDQVLDHPWLMTAAAIDPLSQENGSVAGVYRDDTDKTEDTATQPSMQSV